MTSLMLGCMFCSPPHHLFSPGSASTGTWSRWIGARGTRHEFETALEQTPNRYRTFLGIARAANATGNRQKASEYYGKLVELAKNADTERPETREAKQYLAPR
jgi:hypothetical protein